MTTTKRHWTAWVTYVLLAGCTVVLVFTEEYIAAWFCFLFLVMNCICDEQRLVLQDYRALVDRILHR